MKLFPTLLLLFCFATSYAQESVIEKANNLIKNKKYNTAYTLLNQTDPGNENPQIAVAKTNLVLNYFVSSFMHQLFALRDLEPHEDILEVRGSEGSFSMYSFSPDSVLLNLIEKFPNNYSLHKELGFFYHEVHIKYPGTWLISDSAIVSKFKHYYLNAYKNGIMDYWSLYGIGYAYIVEQEYNSAIPFFKESIAFKSDFASSHYNLAYCYLSLDEIEKGVESAQKAFELYQFPEYKADAARMIAVMYRQLNETQKAIEFFRHSNEIQPGEYYTLKPLLELELSFEMPEYLDRTMQFFLLDPSNPSIYNDLFNIYQTYDKADELYGFLSAQHSNYQTNHMVEGNLYFFKGLINYFKEDLNNAIINLQKSKELFLKVFESDHQVFEVIESILEEINS